MKLNINCKYCKHEIKLSYKAHDRVDLAKEIGEDFHLKCDKCIGETNYHVNDVKATERKSLNNLAVLILLFGTAVISYYFIKSSIIIYVGGILSLPSVIYEILIHQEREATKRFNKYRL